MAPLTPEEQAQQQAAADALAALRAAKPSFLDGRGLFPNPLPMPDWDDSRAIITRSQNAAVIIHQRDEMVRLPPQAPQDDYPAQPTQVCPTSGTITVVFSGITACGCKDFTSPPSPPNPPVSQNITAFSGLNGSHTLAWDSGSSTFILSGVGSVTNTEYPSHDCSGTGFDATSAFDISAFCSGGLWTVSVSSTAAGAAFDSATSEMMGTAMSNNHTCGISTLDLLGDGSATVSP